MFSERRENSENLPAYREALQHVVAGLDDALAVLAARGLDRSPVAEELRAARRRARAVARGPLRAVPRG